MIEPPDGRKGGLLLPIVLVWVAILLVIAHLIGNADAEKRREQAHDLIHERDALAAQAGRFKRERDELAAQNRAVMASLDRIEKVICGEKHR